MVSMHSVENSCIIEKWGSWQSHSRPCSRYAVDEVANGPYLFSFFRGNTGFRQSLISLAISAIFGRQPILFIVLDTLIVGNRVVADEAVNGFLTRLYKLELASLFSSPEAAQVLPLTFGSHRVRFLLFSGR